MLLSKTEITRKKEKIYKGKFHLFIKIPLGFLSISKNIDDRKKIDAIAGAETNKKVPILNDKKPLDEIVFKSCKIN